jgi:hypothetical protein
MYAPSHRHQHPSNKHLTLLAICVKILHSILFGSNSNSNKISMQSDTCTSIYSSQQRDAGQARETKKIGTEVNAACQENLSACHRFVSPGLRGALRESSHCPLQEGGTYRKKKNEK